MMKHSFNCKLKVFFDMMDIQRNVSFKGYTLCFIVIVLFDMLLVFYFAFKPLFLSLLNLNVQVLFM